MTDLAIIIISGAAVLVSVVASHAFHSWLAQRELERLSAIDKAELLKRFEVVDVKLLDLKNNIPSRVR